jgi:transcription antitermination protein NusB
MQTIFEFLARGNETDPTLVKNIDELKPLGDPDSDLAKKLVDGIAPNVEALKSTVEQCAPEWSWERMDAITRAILLVGAYEILHCRDVPPAVVMNEAIDIAKEYGTAESAKFVNGVLNALAHRK